METLKVSDELRAQWEKEDKERQALVDEVMKDLPNLKAMLDILNSGKWRNKEVGRLHPLTIYTRRIFEKCIPTGYWNEAFNEHFKIGESMMEHFWGSGTNSRWNMVESRILTSIGVDGYADFIMCMCQDWYGYITKECLIEIVDKSFKEIVNYEQQYNMEK